MKKRVSREVKKQVCICLLLMFVLLIGAVLVTALVLQNNELSQRQLYTYEDTTSWPPAYLAPGEKVPIIWQPSPDNAPPRLRSASITLAVLLVRDQNFKPGVCGAYPGELRLDTLQVDAASGRVYQRTIQIPPHQPAGVYELVRQITKRKVSSCLAKRLVISPHHSRMFPEDREGGQE